MPRSPSARRATATTSCDVMPAGLSTTRTPLRGRLGRVGGVGGAGGAGGVGGVGSGTNPIYSVDQLLLEERHQVGEVAGGAAAGRVHVPAAAELLRDRVDVRV